MKTPPISISIVEISSGEIKCKTVENTVIKFHFPKYFTAFRQQLNTAIMYDRF